MAQKVWKSSFVERNFSREQALKIIEKFYADMAPKDFTIQSSFEDVYIRCERGWGAGCDLMIRLPNDYTDKSRVYGRDFNYLPIEVKIEYSWGSTYRSLAVATTAANLYQEMIRLGAAIEARLNERIVYEEIHDKPEDPTAE